MKVVYIFMFISLSSLVFFANSCLSNKKNYQQKANHPGINKFIADIEDIIKSKSDNTFRKVKMKALQSRNGGELLIYGFVPNKDSIKILKAVVENLKIYSPEFKSKIVFAVKIQPNATNVI